MKKIYLIRHGRQNSKLCNVDVELDTIGRKQAGLVADRLVSYGIQKLYSSDLIRAKQTAERIGQKIGLKPVIIDDFREIDFGALTGLEDHVIADRFAEFQKQRKKQSEDLPYPDGESGQDVLERVLPYFNQICKSDDNAVAIVTHGGVIRALCAYVTQTEIKHKLKFGVDLENTSITEILYDDKLDMLYLERFNDYAHLEKDPQLLRRSWKTSQMDFHTED